MKSATFTPEQESIIRAHLRKYRVPGDCPCCHKDDWHDIRFVSLPLSEAAYGQAARNNSVSAVCIGCGTCGFIGMWSADRQLLQIVQGF